VPKLRRNKVFQNGSRGQADGPAGESKAEPLKLLRNPSSGGKRNNLRRSYNCRQINCQSKSRPLDQSPDGRRSAHEEDRYRLLDLVVSYNSYLIQVSCIGFNPSKSFGLRKFGDFHVLRRRGSRSPRSPK
jgi:hypothetical protein